MMDTVNRSEGSMDTTFTKIFVGGLAWETQRETMRRYFEQFGEILEAVVISDKHTGKSKGYGFVTFRDPESASRACENPFPVIDGRRANCNLASLGAQKNRPTANSLQGMYRYRQKPATSASSFEGNSAYFNQTVPQGSYPYSFGYPGYSQDYFPMSYYNLYGGQQQQQQQLQSYYPSAGSGSGSPGFYLNYYPYYANPGSMQYPKLVQYPVLTQQFRGTLGFSSIPNSVSPLPIMTARPMTTVANMATLGPGSAGTVSDQKPST